LTFKPVLPSTLALKPSPLGGKARDGAGIGLSLVMVAGYPEAFNQRHKGYNHQPEMDQPLTVRKILQLKYWGHGALKAFVRVLSMG
jgi:hypothetical protein